MITSPHGTTAQHACDYCTGAHHETHCPRVARFANDTMIAGPGTTGYVNTDSIEGDYIGVIGSRHGVRLNPTDSWSWGSMFTTAELANAHRDALPEGSAGRAASHTVRVTTSATPCSRECEKRFMIISTMPGSVQASYHTLRRNPARRNPDGSIHSLIGLGWARITNPFIADTFQSQPDATALQEALTRHGYPDPMPARLAASIAAQWNLAGPLLSPVQMSEPLPAAWLAWALATANLHTHNLDSWTDLDGEPLAQSHL